MLCYVMIWYDMIWYGVVWHDIMWYDMLCYDMIWYDIIWCCMTWYNMIWYDVHQNIEGVNFCDVKNRFWEHKNSVSICLCLFNSIFPSSCLSVCLSAWLDFFIQYNSTIAHSLCESPPPNSTSHYIFAGVYFDFASEFLTTHNIRPILR